MSKAKNEQKLPKDVNEKLKELESILNIYSSGGHLKFNSFQMKAFLTKFRKLINELEELGIVYKDYLK